MKLNGIECTQFYAASETTEYFELTKCTFSDITALEGKTLTATDDEGNPLQTWPGYSLQTVAQVGDGAIGAWFYRKLDDSTKSAIDGLQETTNSVLASFKSFNKKIDEMQATLNTVSTQVATTAKANGWTEEE